MKTYLQLILLLTTTLLTAQKPKLVPPLEGHASEVSAVLFSPNEQLACTSGDEDILWDMKNGRFIRYIEIPEKQSMLCFAPDGQGVIAMLKDNSLVSWDLFKDKHVWQTQLPEALQRSQVSPDGQSLALLFPDQIWCVDLTLGQVRWQETIQDLSKVKTSSFYSEDSSTITFETTTTVVNTLPHFSADGSIITIRTADGAALSAFDAMTGRKKKSLPFKQIQPGSSLLFMKNSKMACTTADKRQLQLIDFEHNWVKTCSNLADFIQQQNIAIKDFAFAPDGKKVVLACGTFYVSYFSTTPGMPAKREDNGALLVWDVQNDTLLYRLDETSVSINALDISDDGTRCLSGSVDKTVCLWDIQNGKELFRLKRQVAMENNIVFTPDFRFMALSKYNGSMKTWNLEQRTDMRFLPNKGTESFALSPDGRLLVSSKRDMWETVTLQHLGQLEDRHRCLEIGTAMDISPDGKMALFGSSKEWRVLYYSLPREFSEKSVQGFVTNAAQDTIGIKVAGDTLYGAVAVSLPRKDTTGSTSITSTDTLSQRTIYLSDDFFNVSLWDLEKKRSVRVFPLFIQEWHPVAALRFSPDGRLAIALMLDTAMKKPDGYNRYLENKLIAWDIATGQVLENPFGKNSFHAIQFEGPEPRAATIGPDNSSAESSPIGSVVTEWSLADAQIRQTYRHDSLVTAVAFHPVEPIICTVTTDSVLTEWDTQTGKKLRQIHGVSPSEHLAYAPDPNFIVLGKGITTIWNLNTGKATLEIGNLDRNSDDLFFEGHAAGQVSQLKFLPNGRYAISTTYEGRIQGWDYKSGTEQFTLFFPGEKDWVVTTPSGLFDASAGALEAMYFSLGTEIIDMEQLKERYYEPGLLAKFLGFSNEPLRDVAGFDSVALYPAVRLRLDTLQNKLHIRLLPRNGGIGKVSVFINGKEIIEEANPVRGLDKIRDTAMTIDLEEYGRYFLADTFNVISIRAYNAAGWLKSAAQDMDFWSVPIRAKGGTGTGAVAPRLGDRRPALYVLAVGTSNYAGTEIDLKYSAKDARDMAGAMQQIGSILFRDSVFVQLLVTDTSDTKLYPTKGNIIAAFDAIKSRAKAEDVLVVYFSGHGVTYNALFYYLTMEAAGFDLGSDSDAGVLAKRTMSSDELTRWINNIPAQKQVLILDACNSGKVVEILAAGQKSISASQVRALDRMKDRTGMFVLTGSAADMVSYEAGQYGQSLLTYSVLQGMKIFGSVGDNRIDVMRLFQYSLDEVPLLAKGIGGIQTPMLVGPSSGSFDIGIVDSTVHIPIAEMKPVFIRNVFMNENTFADDLGLSTAIAGYFQQIAARGSQANLIYVDVSEYENAYSIKGLYNIKADAVTLRGRLFKGKDSKGEFEVSGKTGDLPALVKAIINKVMAMRKSD